MATYARENLSGDPEVSVLLAIQAVNATVAHGQAPVPAAEDALHQAVLSSQLRLTLPGHIYDVFSVAWSPDGKRLATGSGDETAKVWDAGSGKELLTLSGHEGSVKSVAWSPDGKRLATSSLDGTAKIWDGANGQELLTLRGHNGFVESVVWSPDGKRLATGSYDEAAKAWDAASGKELLTLSGHRDGVKSVAWSPDGKRLASAGGDAIVQIYAMDIQELLKLAHGRVEGTHRTLTADQCQRYFQNKTCRPMP